MNCPSGRGKSYKECINMNNLKKISAAVKASDADAIFVTSEQNRYYATGFASSAGELIICGDGTSSDFMARRSRSMA